MIFLAAKHSCDIIVSLSKVYVRILTNQIVSISNDLLCLSGEYSLSTMLEKRHLFLDNDVNFIRLFYFDMCQLSNAFPFVSLYEKFVPNDGYWPETYKIIKKPY